MLAERDFCEAGDRKYPDFFKARWKKGAPDGYAGA
jgi:hypothetical protein